MPEDFSQSTHPATKKEKPSKQPKKEASFSSILPQISSPKMSQTLTLRNPLFSPEPALRHGGGSSPSSAARAASVRAFTATETRRSGNSSLYDVLRVKRNASVTEIKTAYRSLAKLYHPDACSESDSDSDFIAIHNAYSTLSDTAARATYDLSLARPYYSTRTSSSSSPSSSGFYTTRRWETDQCW